MLGGSRIGKTLKFALEKKYDVFELGLKSL